MGKALQGPSHQASGFPVPKSFEANYPAVPRQKLPCSFLIGRDPVLKVQDLNPWQQETRILKIRSEHPQIVTFTRAEIQSLIELSFSAPPSEPTHVI